MRVDLRKRLTKVEARSDGVDWASELVAHRYRPARVYHPAQLRELAEDDGLAGRVARGLIRLRRYADDAPRIEFDGEAELVRTLASLYADPLAWVVFAFEWDAEGALSLVPFEDPRFDVGHGPDGWAAAFLDDIAAEVRERPFDRKTPVPAIRMGISSGHGIGKTMLQSMLMLWAISTRERCRGVATSTTGAQLHTRLWPEMLTWLSRSVVAPFFDTLNARGTMRLFHRDHPNTWRIDGATAAPENSEAFAGLHNATSSTVFLMDEASGIDARIWRAIEGSMVDGAPLLIAMGNPLRRDGEFYRVFTEAGHRWNLRRVDSREAFLPNKDQIAAWLDDWGEDSDFFRVRVKGEFPSQSLTQFIGADLVAAAQERDVRAITAMDAPILGVDVARFGTDASSVAIRCGRNARDLPGRTYHGLDTRQLAMEVARLVNELRQTLGFSHVYIAVDGIGVGAGVVDTLRGWHFDVVDVQVAGRAIDARTYANVRAELYGKLKDWLAGGAIEVTPELAEDITAADFGFNRQGQILLEPKDSIRSRLGRSPDRADALALTFAVEPAVVLPGDPHALEASRKAEREYWQTGRLPARTPDHDPYGDVLR